MELRKRMWIDSFWAFFSNCSERICFSFLLCLQLREERIKYVYNNTGQFRKGECIKLFPQCILHYSSFLNPPMLEIHSSFPPTLPFPVSCGCLGQPNYIVHVKICAFKSAPSQWNASQLCNQQTYEHRNTFFVLFCTHTKYFRIIIMSKWCLGGLFVLFFSFHIYIIFFTKRCLREECQVLGSVELTCYNEIIELVHHTADVYSVCHSAANKNGYRWRA